MIFLILKFWNFGFNLEILSFDSASRWLSFPAIRATHHLGHGPAHETLVLVCFIYLLNLFLKLYLRTSITRHSALRERIVALLRHILFVSSLMLLHRPEPRLTRIQLRALHLYSLHLVDIVLRSRVLLLAHSAIWDQVSFDYELCNLLLLLLLSHQALLCWCEAGHYHWRALISFDTWLIEAVGTWSSWQVITDDCLPGVWLIEAVNIINPLQSPLLRAGQLDTICMRTYLPQWSQLIADRLVVRGGCCVTVVHAVV